MYCFSPNRFSWHGTSSRSCAVACSKDGKCTRPRNSLGSGCKNTTSRNLRVEKNYRFEERLQKNANFSWSLYDHRDRSLFIFGGEGLEDFGCVKTKFTWTPLRLCGSLMISSHKHYTCYSLTLWHCAGADWSSLRSPENHSISSPPHPPIIPPPTQP